MTLEEQNLALEQMVDMFAKEMKSELLRHLESGDKSGWGEDGAHDLYVGFLRVKDELNIAMDRCTARRPIAIGYAPGAMDECVDAANMLAMVWLALKGNRF